MAAKVKEPSYGMDKLSSEIFSILESKFLFGGPDDTTKKSQSQFSPVVSPRLRSEFPSTTTSGGRVRILSVDAGGTTDGLLAASSLALLESSLQLLTSNPSARIPDFFDLAAGSGVGGLIVSLLFTTNSSSSHPLLSAAEVLRFLSNNHRIITKATTKKNIFSLFGGKKKGPNSILRSVFGDLTLRDTVKPVLIPCYDLATGGPFVFSRADAVEIEGYDFRMREVCEATMGMAETGEKKMKSVDGRTKIAAAAVDGGVATANPASVAITHVLNNKMEFPFVRGVEDLFLVSVGNGEAGGFRQPGCATPSTAGIVKLAGDGISDMIDQAVALAFGQCRAANYVRIQGREQKPCNLQAERRPSEALPQRAEEMLAQRNVESILFCGKKLSEKTNAEKLDWAAGELVMENDRRKKSPLPFVVFKRGSPWSSSSSSSALSSSEPSSP